MSNRTQRADVARQTLDILEQGFYSSPAGVRIEIASSLERARSASILFAPDDFDSLSATCELLLADGLVRQTKFEVHNETTLDAARRLVEEGERVLALNFASAKNPGGGFLGGSQAQEESLARATGIYSCLLSQERMYSMNRRCGTCLYTDHMIYSPDVPVFRDSGDRLLDEIYEISFLTAPAVNAGVVKRNEPYNADLIEPTMIARIEKVLSIALAHRHDVLVLGAWGCGVFENDPANVARWFALHLKEDKFRSAFSRVVFAVLDGSGTHKTLAPFLSRFA